MNWTVWYIMSTDLVQFKVTTLFARDRGFKLRAMFYTIPDNPDSSYASTRQAPVNTYWSISDLGTISVTERSCASPISKVERHISGRFCSTLWCNCLVRTRQTSLSLDENVRAKEGGKEKTGETSVPFGMVPCGSSPVTRVSRSPLRCEKRSAWGGGCP